MASFRSRLKYLVHAISQSTLGKYGYRFSREASVRMLGLARRSSHLRNALHLPPNEVVSPLATSTDPAFRTVVTSRARVCCRPLPQLPESGAALPFFRARAIDPGEDEFVTVLQKGKVWGYAHGAVFTPKGEFIPAFSRDPWGQDLHGVWVKPWLPSAQRLAGRALYLVTPEAKDNYHHWLIDLLPRLHAVESAGFALADFDYVLVKHAERAYQYDTFERLGLPRSKIINLNPRICLQPDELVVPSLKASNETLSLEHVRFLRRRFLAESEGVTPARRRLFLSRREAAQRRLENEDEVFRVFAARGFELVTLSGMSVAEQAALFQQAEWIAGPSGAAFANLVFATPGCRVLELASAEWLTVYHWMISAQLGLRHAVLLENDDRPRDILNIRERGSHVRLDPVKAARVLDELLGRPEVGMTPLLPADATAKQVIPPGLSPAL